MMMGRSPAASTIDMRDWRKALRAGPSYRITSRTFRFHFYFALLMTGLGSLLVIFFYIRPASKSTYSDINWLDNRLQQSIPAAAVSSTYNHTYPLSEPISSNGIDTYRIGLIADMDRKSKEGHGKHAVFHSYFKKGYLSFNRKSNSIDVTFDEDPPIKLTDSYAYMGRGMELSELVTFNGRLLTFDDRTGLVYELIKDNVVPWVLLMDGNGRTSKGFKSEWATVKDNYLYVGSMGKEWTSSSGEFENFDPMFVKMISVTGEVHHVNWIENYKALRSAIGIKWPGYMIHESAMWSPIHRKWFFLPRRCSKEKYNETKDELMGCNILLTASEDFSSVKVIKLAEYNSSQGFSSFKFVPGSGDNIIVALQTEEIGTRTATYITAFTSDTGRTILPQQHVSSDFKFEGFEFI